MDVNYCISRIKSDCNVSTKKQLIILDCIRFLYILQKRCLVDNIQFDICKGDDLYYRYGFHCLQEKQSTTRLFPSLLLQNRAQFLQLINKMANLRIKYIQISIVWSCILEIVVTPTVRLTYRNTNVFEKDPFEKKYLRNLK